MKKITYLFMALTLCSFSVNANNTSDEAETGEGIKRVRLIFHTDIGYQRELLLAFFDDNSATDNYDYGYDAVNADNLPNDMDYMVGEKRCVIQGVGEFKTENKYAFGMHIQMDTKITIALSEVENFDDNPFVYIYDSATEEYFNINEDYFITDMLIGNYNERFSIVVSQQAKSSIEESLNVEDFINDLQENPITYSYSKTSQEFKLTTSTSNSFNSVKIYNLSGQKLYQSNKIGRSEFIMANMVATQQPLVVRAQLNNKQIYTKLFLLK